jgi:hypothetical protein
VHELCILELIEQDVLVVRGSLRLLPLFQGLGLCK